MRQWQWQTNCDTSQWQTDADVSVDDRLDHTHALYIRPDLQAVDAIPHFPQSGRVPGHFTEIHLFTAIYLCL